VPCMNGVAGAENQGRHILGRVWTKSLPVSNRVGSFTVCEISFARAGSFTLSHCKTSLSDHVLNDRFGAMYRLSGADRTQSRQ
jgi:hypothetical protein